MDASKLIRFCGLVVELHMHTNVYACGCLLSVTCQVAMVNSYGTLKEQCPYIRLKIDGGHFDGLVFFVHPECPC